MIGPPFKVLDAAVAKNGYLLGNDFTVADLNVAAVISRAIDMDLSAWPHLKVWLTNCLSARLRVQHSRSRTKPMPKHPPR